MYQKYHTEAIVLRAIEAGESDKTFVLFTQDFGLVRARASAVRTEYSKMRYALQLYSYAHVSLVKGKNGWRVAGATALNHINAVHGGARIFARIAELIVRLVVGEECNRYLFEVLKETHGVLRNQGAPAPAIELIGVARVLYALGYISAEALQTSLFAHAQFGEPEMREAEILRDSLLLSINRAIAETQL